MQQKNRPRANGESGVAAVLFALMAVAMIGMLAIVVDLGFLFGQRRFDQNGADAAALAAGRLLAANVSPDDSTGTTVFFGVSDEDVYKLVRNFAGLDPADTSSDTPTGVNQNPGVSARNALTVTLEYGIPDSSGNVSYCSSPSNTVPAPSPVCTLDEHADVDGNELLTPPDPPDNVNSPYRVRVVVGSKTSTYFARIWGQNDMNAIGLAVVGVGGKASLDTSGYQLIPVTTCVGQLDGDEDSGLFGLWSSTVETCGYRIQAGWKNTLDLTTADKWCDNVPDDYVSGPGGRSTNFADAMPSGAAIDTTKCHREAPNRWSRSDFVSDSAYPGWDDAPIDLQYWIPKGFGGTVVVNNRFPTYGTGNLGQNIAMGFYCDNSALVDSCPGNTIATPTGNISVGTYFFANTPGRHFQPVCDDWWGQTFGLGCRDALIPLWDHPQYYESGEFYDIQQTGATHFPDRVQVTRLAVMRLYCQHATPSDPDTPCSGAPNDVTGNSGNSNVWGRFISGFDPSCTDCTGKPSIYDNAARLEQ